MLKRNNKTKTVAGPQGISANSNALGKIASISALITLTPAILGLGYLIALRDPGLQEARINDASAAIAMRQAATVEHTFANLAMRLDAAAKTSTARAGLDDPSSSQLEALEASLLAHFPEALSVRLLPIGKMGTAVLEEGAHGVRSYIEMDLLRRTALEETAVTESYQVDNRWITSQASLITADPDNGNRALILSSYDNARIAEALMRVDGSLGQSVLVQSYQGGKSRDTSQQVTQVGEGNAQRYTQHAAIPGSSWQIAFTPSAKLVDGLTHNTLPLWAILALLALSALAAAAIAYRLATRTLATQVEKIIDAADLKTPLELKQEQLVPVAKALRRATLRSQRPGVAAAVAELPQEVEQSTDELTGTLFQSGEMLDDEDKLEQDVGREQTPGRTAIPKDDSFPYHLFRAYDIRGNAGDLSHEAVARIGGAIARLCKVHEQQTLIVGSDCRTTSPAIKTTLIKTLMECGRDVIDIGIVPTPVLYFATRHLNCPAAVMVTGSHNPGEDNGFKIVMDGQSIAGDLIEQLRQMVIENRLPKGNGRTIREDIIPAYTEEVISDIAIAVPLKIVVDAGNGATSELAPALLEELGCEVVPLYCELDGTFPNHPPDTSDEANLKDLAATVTQVNADFGVAFDGDGDRLAVVTGSGQIIRSDVLLMLFAQDVVSRNPGADVVFDVKCSRNLSQLVTRYGGRPVLWKTGHAFMKEKMQQTGALLGGEFSGHMFFGERWFGFDDGIYAASRLAEILSTHGHTLDEALADFPPSVSTPEIRIPVADGEKFTLMEKFASEAEFTSGKITTLDGIRVDYPDGWGLLRASNTGAALTARFEASTAEAMEAIMEEFRTQAALAAPELQLTF